MKFKYLLLLFIAFAFPAFADQLIIEPDMGRAPLLNAINHTKYSLDLVMYGFTDERLRDAIIAQSSKSLKIILEQSPYKSESENIGTQQLLSDHHIAWLGSIPSIKLIHQKTLIIDDKQAIVMTFNFTHSSFSNERNFGLVIDDPKEVHEIAATFNADWNHTPITHNDPHLLYSPDNSRQKLISMIANAKHSIQIYAQSVSDYNLIGALASTARKGIDVTIITSGTLRDKQARYLSKAGVNIHQSKLYIHAKVFIFDHQTAVIGSINLTRASLDDNRELSVITEDATVIRQLEETFTRDLGTSSATRHRTVRHVADWQRSYRLLMKSYRHYQRVASRMRHVRQTQP